MLNNPAVATQAADFATLAKAIGLPPDAVVSSVERYNKLVEAGVDEDFGRFGKGHESIQSSHRRAPCKIENGPFYAIQFYPLARKSMGGIAVDRLCRVLTGTGQTIPGLYAAGEASGEGGINGIAALEGTFLGPSMYQGRIVGRQIEMRTVPARLQTETTPQGGADSVDKACVTCHNLPSLVAKPRKGYWHFERVHSRVLARELPCTKCHAEMSPFRVATHKISRVNQAKQCSTCHLVTEE